MAIGDPTDTGGEMDQGNFYVEQNITASYVAVDFEFQSSVILLDALAEDGTVNSGNVSFSFDGTNLHGVLRPNEGIPMEGKKRPSIWVKGTLNDKLRIFAW